MLRAPQQVQFATLPKYFCSLKHRCCHTSDDFLGQRRAPPNGDSARDGHEPSCGGRSWTVTSSGVLPTSRARLFTQGLKKIYTRLRAWTMIDVSCLQRSCAKSIFKHRVPSTCKDPLQQLHLIRLTVPTHGSAAKTGATRSVWENGATGTIFCQLHLQGFFARPRRRS